MKMNLPRSAVAAFLAVLLSTGAYAAGNWSTLPQVGQPSFCGSTVSGTGSLAGVTGQGQGTIGSICGQTIPAGPTALTGNELVPADTPVVGGPIQTATIPSGLLSPGASGANALVGSDFGLNLWQRGTTAANGNSITPSSATLVADGWYVFSTGNTVAVSKQTGAADIPTALSPTLASMRVGRPSGSNLTPICTGQILSVKDSQRFLGNNAIFSGYLLAGAGLSSTNSAVTMTIAYYTAADSPIAGTNTGTFASSIGATQNIAGYIETVNGVQNISTTWTRYSVSATIPTANASGTAVTGVGVKICYTPTGTGGATDNFELANAQFEPRAGTSVGASSFNRRAFAEEAGLEYSRSFESTESGETVIHGSGQAMTTTVAEAYIQFPVEMRLATPTATLANGFGATLSSGIPHSCTTTAQGALPSSASSAKLIDALGMSVSCTIADAGLAAGNASLLVDNAGSGNIQVSAEP